MDNRAIGIFDSGLGGLTAVQALRELAPGENIIYFADSGRVPYGSRPVAQLRKMAQQDMELVASMGVKAIIAACGTVSANALPELRKIFDIPIIGVVEGAAEAAVKNTANRKIAVIGTTATIKSGAFEREIHRLDSSVEVVSQDCPLFVPLVENGFVGEDDEIALMVCKKYLKQIDESGADTVILGCTHYPIIAHLIAKVLPGRKLINTGEEAARKALDILGKPERGEASVRYYASDDVTMFKNTASLFLGEDPVGKVEMVNPMDF